MANISVYSDANSFEYAQRVAKALASSDLVPEQYRGNIPNTMLALDMANRIGMPPIMVMQNLHMMDGRPSWSSPFIISAINTCGRFSPLRFVVEKLGRQKVKKAIWEGPKGARTKREIETEIDDVKCYAVAEDAKGREIEGPAVTISMAVAEGWYDRAGSKWPTMPELMLRYRAAAFFGRLYAPDILLGMKATDEYADGAAAIEDAEAVVVSSSAPKGFEAVNRQAEAAAVRQDEPGGDAAEAAEEWI